MIAALVLALNEPDDLLVKLGGKAAGASAPIARTRRVINRCSCPSFPN